MHLALPYVQWMLMSSPFLFIYITYTSILRGVGDSTTPLMASSLTIIVGVIVTPVLIGGYLGMPKLGIIASNKNRIGKKTEIAAIASTPSICPTKIVLIVPDRFC
ncbi:MATE family efflux transporter, partial [Vogesella mureinivorans]|uniref:MATE family efflux transporter n=1 Tax=Vogesella mureinivorans TaxID=657276 RepID=UPI001F0FB069